MFSVFVSFKGHFAHFFLIIQSCCKKWEYPQFQTLLSLPLPAFIPYKCGQDGFMCWFPGRAAQRLFWLVTKYGLAASFYAYVFRKKGENALKLFF
jgi:hypothetical protein